MPVTGRPPKPRGASVTRHRLTFGFNEFPDVPFTGAPPLPPRRGGWPKATLAWWAAISRMPHCVDWTPSDWTYAFDAARLSALFQRFGEVKYEAALRARERVMGTTADARRSMRITYIDANPEPDDDAVARRPLSLVDFKRMMDEDPP